VVQREGAPAGKTAEYRLSRFDGSMEPPFGTSSGDITDFMESQPGGRGDAGRLANCALDLAVRADPRLTVSRRPK